MGGEGRVDVHVQKNIQDEETLSVGIFAKIFRFVCSEVMEEHNIPKSKSHCKILLIEAALGEKL